MSTITNIWKNHIMVSVHQRKRQYLCKVFQQLSTFSHTNYLSLYNYVEISPERFYSRQAFKIYYEFLVSEYSRDPSQLSSLLNSNEFALNKAFHSLAEINRYDWHDSSSDMHDYELMRFCDNCLNTTYLKLLEEVYYSFIYIIAAISRLNRETPLAGLDVYNCVEEIKNSIYSSLCLQYNNIIRNGIAHGGVTYRQQEIVYKDKRGNSHTISMRDLNILVDDLLDICNGIALAKKIFYLQNLGSIIIIPQQIMIEELQAQTESPWWHIEGSLISELAVPQVQLVIYAHAYTRDYNKVFYSTFLSAVLCEQFASGFDRYFFSIQSPFALPGWAAFDGIKLSQIRARGPKSEEDYKGVLENNLVFFVPYIKLPSLFNKIETLLFSFRVQWPIALEEIKQQFKRLDILVRNIDMHRNGWRSVVNGSIVIEWDDSKSLQDKIRKSCKSIINKAHGEACRRAKVNNICKFLPLGFARIGIFAKDYRKRKLKGYGLGPSLIGTIEFKKISRIKNLDIIGATIEIIGPFRIAWNKAWIESL